jgi:hypothetical protein
MVTSSAPIACLAVCYPEKPDCPSPLVSSSLCASFEHKVDTWKVVGGGPVSDLFRLRVTVTNTYQGCYTCCIDDGSDMSPSTQFPLLHSGKKSHSILPSLAVKSFELTNKRDACLMVCYEEPECPEGLVSEQISVLTCETLRWYVIVCRRQRGKWSLVCGTVLTLTCWERSAGPVAWSLREFRSHLYRPKYPFLRMLQRPRHFMQAPIQSKRRWHWPPRIWEKHAWWYAWKNSQIVKTPR